MVGRPFARRVVEARDDRLEGRDPPALRGQPGADRRGDHRLADARCRCRLRRGRARGPATRLRSGGRTRARAARPSPAVRSRRRRRSRCGACRMQRSSRSRARPACSSDAECDAITASRSRDVPSGTVGGRIAWAKMPRSSSRSDAATAARRGADHERQDLRLASRSWMPSSASASASSRALRCSLNTRSRLLDQQLERGQRAGDGRRRQRGREDQRARGVDQVLRHRAVAAGVRAVGAERLAERADDDVDLVLDARRRPPRRGPRARARRRRGRRPPSRARRSAAPARRSRPAARRRRPSRRRRR